MYKQLTQALVSVKQRLPGGTHKIENKIKNVIDEMAAIRTMDQTKIEEMKVKAAKARAKYEQNVQTSRTDRRPIEMNFESVVSQPSVQAAIQCQREAIKRKRQEESQAVETDYDELLKQFVSRKLNRLLNIVNHIYVILNNILNQLFSGY